MTTRDKNPNPSTRFTTSDEFPGFFVTGWEETNFPTPKQFSKYLYKVQYEVSHIKTHLLQFEEDIRDLLNRIESVLMGHISIEKIHGISQSLQGCVGLSKASRNNKSTICDVYAEIH